MDSTQRFAEALIRRLNEESLCARCVIGDDATTVGVAVDRVASAVEQAISEVFRQANPSAEDHPAKALSPAQRDLAYDMALRAALFYAHQGKDPEAAIAPMIRAAISAAVALRAGSTEAEVGHG